MLAVVPVSAQVDAKKPFDVWALQRIARVSEPQLSPDGYYALIYSLPLAEGIAHIGHLFPILEGGALVIPPKL